MAYNFSSDIISLESFSRGDHQEITASKNHSYSTELSDTEDDDAQVLENAINNKVNLEERLQRLKGTMGELRKQLAEERSMWKKQLEEATRESVPYEQRKEISVVEEVDVPKEIVLPEDMQAYLPDLPRPDYEGPLNDYQENVIKTLADRRASLRRQISINNYKRRLLEVENMCNLELLRVKQSVQFLQPLQMMASEWKSRNVGEPNFAFEEFNTETHESPTLDCSNVTKMEDTFPIELSGNRISNESNPLYTKPHHCGRQSPQVKSSSGVWQDGDVTVTLRY